MKKSIVISVVILITLLFGAFYYYRLHKNNQSEKIAHDKEVIAKDIAVFFNYAQEQLPKVATDLEMAKKERQLDKVKVNRLKEETQTYKIAQAIANYDLNALEAFNPEELQAGQIWVEGDRFQDTMEGKLVSRILGGSALAFVLFHSVMDKTAADKNRTIAMLKILFAKKIDPNIEAGEAFWVKDKPTDTKSYDYISLHSLPEVAMIYSFPEVQQLIENYIKSFKKD